MKALAVLSCCLPLFATAAQAGLTHSELAAVEAGPAPNARIDLDLTAADTSGSMRRLGDILQSRPAFLNFVDYSCTILCGTNLQLLSVALVNAGIDPSTYRVVTLGIGSNSTPSEAIAMEEKEIPSELRPVTTFLLPDRTTIERATAALGYRFAYDQANNQYAHAAAVYVLASDGAVRGILSPFDLTATDIASVIAAATPLPASLYERIRLLCYGHDAVTGLYTASIRTVLQAASFLTLAVLGAALLLMWRARRRTP